MVIMSPALGVRGAVISLFSNDEISMGGRFTSLAPASAIRRHGRFSALTWTTF